MANRFAIIVCLVGLCFKLASCQGICTPHSRPYSGNPPLPNIPNSFTLDFTIYATINGTTEESLNRLFVDSERKLAVEGRPYFTLHIVGFKLMLTDTHDFG